MHNPQRAQTNLYWADKKPESGRGFAGLAGEIIGLEAEGQLKPDRCAWSAHGAIAFRLVWNSETRRSAGQAAGIRKPLWRSWLHDVPLLYRRS